MERLRVQPRTDWQRTVESQGFLFHSADEQPYWDERACYRFSAREIDELEAATYRLNDMCLEAVQHIVNEADTLFPRFAIPDDMRDMVVRSWHRDEITIYGRFDLAYDGQSPPRLLEYNADTPTSLLEAAVIQWYWLQDRKPDLAGNADQFNSIHERLIEAWKRYRSQLRGTLCFSSLPDALEDFITVSYLRDTAMQAGLETEFLAIPEIRWDESQKSFVRGLGKEGSFGYREEPITNLFKLYPWEWLVREPFGKHLPEAPTRWMEAPWKMLLSNKALLPVLYQLFPDSPYLLRAEFEPFGDTYVRKPILAREGACVTIVQNGSTVAETDGVDFYRRFPSIYQAYQPLPQWEGNHPVIGSWMVNGWACGIGIREDTSPITGNTSRFVPHFFTP